MKTWTDRNGRTWQSDAPRPFVVVVGERRQDRYFGSLGTAARNAPASARLFFESAPGIGRFIGYASEVPDMTAKRKRPIKLSRASAYYRLAAKAEHAGNFRQALIYRQTADRLVGQNRSEQDRLRQQFGGRR